MDFSIQRIDSSPARRAGRRRQPGAGDPEFAIEGERPHPAAHLASEGPERPEDVPVSRAGDDEAGGRLDVTA